MKKIMVAYVTKTGTTKEAAQEIGKVFSEKDIEVDIVELKEAKNPEDYDAVIIGAPINGMQWHPDAVAYVENNAEELREVYVSYYLMSYIFFTGRKLWRNAIKNSLNKVSKTVEPVAVGMFGGKINSRFTGFLRVFFGIKKDAPTDVRNPEEVRKWAEDLVKGFLANGEDTETGGEV